MKKPILRVLSASISVMGNRCFYLHANIQYNRITNLYGIAYEILSIMVASP